MRRAPIQRVDGYDSDTEDVEPDQGRSTDSYPCFKWFTDLSQISRVELERSPTERVKRIPVTDGNR